ncbi:transporter [Geothrix sp.]|uniref:transporter n=1 Tax=Geothrix sp. TaxID=1962974 RepID=UPI0025BBECFE|nr:transporter [Geothrix sp.]
MRQPSSSSPALALVLAAVFSNALGAQEPSRPTPIQDNSFLLEEAYNQETGVIQHIQTFSRLQRSGDWVYTFTEEWPWGGQRHQLSLTAPVQRLASSPDGGRRGMGDLALNYRYQALGDGSSVVAFSPRLSVLLPTGNHNQGRGNGNPGLQVNLPLSVVLSDRFVTHMNLGYTYTPHAKDLLGHQADIGTTNIGQSFVWLARQDVNLLLEFAYTSGEVVAGPGVRQPTQSAFISPGIRWAHTFPSGLQIVPGVAVPIGVGASRGEKAIFLYLSFEHPFTKGK